MTTIGPRNNPNQRQIIKKPPTEPQAPASGNRTYSQYWTDCYNSLRASGADHGTASFFATKWTKEKFKLADQAKMDSDLAKREAEMAAKEANQKFSQAGKLDRAAGAEKKLDFLSASDQLGKINLTNISRREIV